MENFNNVPSQGKFGDSVAVVNENFMLAQQKMEELQSQYDGITQSDIIVGSLPASGIKNTIYRVPNTTSYSDYMWNGTQFVKMAEYDNAIDDEPTPNSNNLVTSGGVAASVIFDISAYHATGGTLATYADLTAALGTGGANIPEGLRKGGMSAKFVRISDNKYIQARCMAQNFTTDVTQWQCVDDIPTAGSDNLVKGGGIVRYLQNIGIAEYEVYAYPVQSAIPVTGVIHVDSAPIELFLQIVEDESTHTSNNIFACKIGNEYRAIFQYIGNGLYYLKVSESPLSQAKDFEILIRGAQITVAGNMKFKIYTNASKSWIINYPNVFDVSNYTGNYNYTGITEAADAVPEVFRKSGIIVRFNHSRQYQWQSYSQQLWNNAEYWKLLEEDELRGELYKIFEIFSKTYTPLSQSNIVSGHISSNSGEIISGGGSVYIYDISNVQGFVAITGRSPGSEAAAAVSISDSSGNIIDVFWANEGVNFSNRIILLPKNAATLNVYRDDSAPFAVNSVEFTHIEDIQQDIQQDIQANSVAISKNSGNLTQLIADNFTASETFIVNPSNTLTEKALRSDGGLDNNAGYQVRVYDVRDIRYIQVSGRSPGADAYCLAVAKDIKGNLIHTYYIGTGLYYSRQEIVLPDTAVTLYVNQAVNTTTAIPEAYAEKFLLDANLNEYWKNKTIWWCGTSIPAGTASSNYPNIVGVNLGATVINKAVGGSMCRANTRTGDYVDANYENITSALTMTKAEAESFITNYNTIQPTLRSGAPATMNDSYKARIRAASFEDRLLPYLDGTYPMPDLFVIDHGHNDFKYKLPDNSTDIGLEPTRANITNGLLAEDTYMTANNNEKLESFFGSLSNIESSKKDAFICSLNRNCYKGAINFLVTLILKHNPRARIVFISNYEDEHGDYPSYAPLITAQQDNAASWAFPLCEVYKYLGFSNHIIPSTKDFWAEQGYTFANDIDVFKIYCPDTVHPHSDTSGYTNNIYAGVLAEFIKTCR